MTNETNNKMVIPIPLEKIIIGENIRSEYNEERINELAESLKSDSQMQNIQVYEKNNEYVIIFGHRRYLAAKKAGLKKLLSHVVPKPTNKDIIYRQIVENEQFEIITPEDREAYVKKLRSMGEPYEEIARRINKSVSWVRQIEIAFNTRSKMKEVFDRYNFNPTTTDLTLINNAKKEEVEEAVKLICKAPEKKNDLFIELSQKNKKKMNSGKKPRKSINDNNLNPDNNNQNNKDRDSLSIKSEILTKIIHNDDKSISLFIEKINFEGRELDNFLELISKFFKEKGAKVIFSSN
jgi:ParB family chromosome partitioning protein